MEIQDLLLAKSNIVASTSFNLHIETEFHFIEAYLYNFDTLVVVFEPAGGEDPRNNGFRVGWGVDVFRKKSCSVMSIKPKRVNWYVTPDLEEAFCKLFYFFKKFRRIVTYGVSMGGFGALAYADNVSANEVYAFSPQTTLDPTKIKDDRFPRAKNWDFSTPRGDVVGRFTSVTSTYILFDFNAPLDRNHADRLEGSQIKRVNIPGSGHSAIELVKDCGALGLVIDSIISGNFDRKSFYRKLRNRRSLETYKNEIIHQWKRRSGLVSL